MKKSILNLGAQELSKNEQKSVNGGKLPYEGRSCNGSNPYGAPYCCINKKIAVCGYA